MLDYRAHTFLAVVRTGSFTRAAEELHVTQPAVSQHVRQLEAHYGCALFSRKRVAAWSPPARDGCSTRRSTRRGTTRTGCAPNSTRCRARRTRAPPLRLGCTRTIADYVAPRLLAQHLVRHPSEHVLMRTGNTAELVALIDA